MYVGSSASHVGTCKAGRYRTRSTYERLHECLRPCIGVGEHWLAYYVLVPKARQQTQRVQGRLQWQARQPR